MSCPAVIRVMLDIYTAGEDTEEIIRHNERYVGRGGEGGVIYDLVTNDLIEKDEDLNGRTWKATEKGKAWVRMIYNTPHPIQIWVDVHGDTV